MEFVQLEMAFLNVVLFLKFQVHIDNLIHNQPKIQKNEKIKFLVCNPDYGINAFFYIMRNR